MNLEEELSVTISCQGFKETVVGRTPEEVFRGVAKVLSQHFPLYQLVSGLVFKEDYVHLFTELEGLVTFFSEGDFVLEFGPEVSDFDTVLICLICAYAGYELNLREKNSMTINETYNVVKASELEYSRKTVNNRLGDLAKMNLAKRIGKGEYRVNELGIKHFLEKSLETIKGKK
jgi:hypothetical protein